MPESLITKDMIDVLVQIVSGLIKGIFGLLWDIIVSIFNMSPKRKQTYDADFLNKGEIISSFNKGYSLNGHQNISLKHSHMSALALGGSGSGKSVCVAIPTILNLIKQGQSLAILDTSGELFPATSGFAKLEDYNIKIFNPSRPDISEGFNPMKRNTEMSAHQKTASQLIRNTLGESSKDLFWNLQSTLLVTMLMMILKFQDKSYQNLANVKFLLDSMANPDGIDVLVAQTKDRTIINEYKQFLVMDKKLLTNITSTSRASLASLSDPNLQKMTAFDTIDFESFREQKTILYLQTKTGDLKYYSALYSILFEQFFSYIMEQSPNKEQRSIFFILDESGNLFLPSLQQGISNLRKYSSGLMLLAQDFNQFVHLYGSYEASAIKTNCFSRIYFPGQPLETCRELESLLGNFQFEDESGNIKTRQLMTADEIRAMEQNTALILTGSNRAIHTKMYPYFKSAKYKGLANLPVPEMKSKVPFDELPILPLPKKVKPQKYEKDTK